LYNTALAERKFGYQVEGRSVNQRDSVLSLANKKAA